MEREGGERGKPLIRLFGEGRRGGGDTEYTFSAQEKREGENVGSLSSNTKAAKDTALNTTDSFIQKNKSLKFPLS